MQSMKESAANIAASAKAGMDKTKATVQEKVDKMTAHDPMEKEMATERKEERKMQAELDKQEAREHNAAAKQATSVVGGPGYTTADSYSHSTASMHGRPTGGQQMAALAGHGMGHPAGQVTEGVVGSHPGGGPGYTTADSYSHSSTGMHGRQQMSGLAGHGTGQPAGQVTEGVVGSHPVGVNTGTGHNPAHNTRVGGGGGATGYGTGGSYA